jgi:hypothetical protein
LNALAGKRRGAFSPEPITYEDMLRLQLHAGRYGQRHPNPVGGTGGLVDRVAW